MKKAFLAGIFLLLGLVHFAYGVVPQKWELRTLDDFLEGKCNGISVSEDGALSLSPKERELESPAEEFFLSFILAPDGVAYLGTGHGGKIYRIDRSGKSELYFQVPEMDVYCLALDRNGHLFAGTSPNGKIYKITEKGKGEVFFNPQEKYIWDLLFTEKDRLLAAVGETGGIYEISQEGEGRLLFRAEQNHILCLEHDEEGNLLMGSGGKGLLYRFSPGRKAAVLFESPYEEIRNIALDDQGNIYAAAGGRIIPPKKAEITPAPVKTETEVIVTVTPTPAETRIPSPAREKQPSAIYRISPEGIAKRIWHSDEDLIYSLIWDERAERLIFGTGNKGRIYSLSKEEKFSLLLQKNSEQVYSLVHSGPRIYVISNNPTDFSVLYPEQRESGEYYSRVYDTRTVSSWGRMTWKAELPEGASLQLQTRSGNSQQINKSWSEWSPPYQKEEGEQVLSPKSRYIQFRIIFKTTSGKVSPLLSKVSLYYLQANIEPTISRLELLPPNQVYLKPPEQDEVIWGTEREAARKSRRDKKRTYALAKRVERKGFQTIVWEAADENGDNLLYHLYIRREEDERWRVLKKNWKETIFAFDTVSFPDGIYYLKVEVTDSPSNPPGMELKTSRLSDPLLIDNSLPVIRNFQSSRDRNKVTVAFTAEDSMSAVEEVLYIVRPNSWRSVFPSDGICDSKQESFEFEIVLSATSDNFVTFKVKDSHGNIGVYRYSF
ncbi:MAG: hypothetical protein ACE5L7_08510 [Candidatus Aminicenantales bacterium]